MRPLVCLLSLTFLVSCAQTPTAVNGWIDIPLSENTYAQSSTDYKSGTYEIPVASGEALEYKLNIMEGDSVSYEWTVEMQDSELLEVEFHGHTDRVGEEPGLRMFYSIHKDGRESGTLTAPFSGIHGWYLNNTSEEDVVVVLNVAGFYTEVD